MITETALAQAVAAKLHDTSTYADPDGDIVDGSLEEVIEAVLAVLNEHGPVTYGE